MAKDKPSFKSGVKPNEGKLMQAEHTKGPMGKATKPADSKRKKK
jgi:hypothetical protein